MAGIASGVNAVGVFKAPSLCAGMLVGVGTVAGASGVGKAMIKPS